MLTVFLAIPVLAAFLLLFCKKQAAFARITRLAASAIIVFSIVFCIQSYDEILVIDLSAHTWIKYAVMAIEAAIAAYIIYVAVKRKAMWLLVFSAVQISLMLSFELLHHFEPTNKTLYIDRLSLLMILIVGVIGGLICIYAVEYMKDYHRHHVEIKDRRGFFFAVLFVFLAAMLGLVICNDMTLMLFFWEITSLASFLLIGYTKKLDAIQNSLLAITINVFGGLLFTAGVVILGYFYGVSSFDTFLAMDETPTVLMAVFLIAVAALTKSAQMPFSRWLLGAMVAPTPTSALLHSSTMVKAGVYLLLRISPMLGANAAGVCITMVGGVTFFVSAMLAVSQRDSKRILAYSTISNLGLIVACVGIDTAESLWAAVMLMVFHAIAKSLLFLTVGSTEHQLGSRNVEEMDGLIGISKPLTILLIVGIAGMFVAPFGMLISKWAAMKAFLDSNNIFVVLLVAFGSTVTLFFWTKWMGKLIAKAERMPPTSYIMRIDEKVSLYSLAVMVVLVCVAHPLVSHAFVIPYIISNQYVDFVSPISGTASTIIIFMLFMVFVIPLILRPIFKKHDVKSSLVYLSGENTGDNGHFYASRGQIHQIEMHNWYMEDLFGESIWLNKSIIVCAVMLTAGLCALLGGFIA